MGLTELSYPLVEPVFKESDTPDNDGDSHIERKGD